MLLSLSPVLPRGAPVRDLAAHYQASSNTKEHAPAYEDEVGRHGGRKEEEEEEGAAGGGHGGEQWLCVACIGYSFTTSNYRSQTSAAAAAVSGSAAAADNSQIRGKLLHDE